ncbi:hypothetical protein F0562_016767 [Nyssa sinensis]|uniref:Uncharacterized protein n=1 Tax=Nyssa sinensis TaxID=561372 RepID=A0A5J4ZHL2_9ASTE|nr:hypothetical protein F0562_016767 [Nyssa sinensis]
MLVKSASTNHASSFYRLRTTRRRTPTVILKGFCFHHITPASNFFLDFSTHFPAAYFNNQDMDTSNPAVFVNAELLRMYVGRRVRAVIQVIRSDGGVIIGKSTDEKQLVVKGSPPPVPLSTFVEVIGIADSNQSINAETWTNFGDTFGMISAPLFIHPLLVFLSKTCGFENANSVVIYIHINIFLFQMSAFAS